MNDQGLHDKSIFGEASNSDNEMILGLIEKCIQANSPNLDLVHKNLQDRKQRHVWFHMDQRHLARFDS